MGNIVKNILSMLPDIWTVLLIKAGNTIENIFGASQIAGSLNWIKEGNTVEEIFDDPPDNGVNKLYQSRKYRSNDVPQYPDLKINESD